MSISPAAELGTFEVLNSFCFEVTGRHAVRYLNNRLSQDIARMPVDSATALRAAALSAQGKLEALLTVQRIATDRFLIASEFGAADETGFNQMFLRYKVADDVQLTRRPELALVHSNDAAFLQKLEVPSWKRNRGLTNGKDTIVPRSMYSEGNSFEQSSLFRIRSGEPQFGIDFGDDVLISEAGFSDAVSFTKGCYVGQEVVARIDALGKPPRLLFRFSAPHNKEDSSEALSKGEPIFATVGNSGDSNARAREVGEITNGMLENMGMDNHSATDRWIGFALIRNDERLFTDTVRFYVNCGANQVAVNVVSLELSLSRS